MTQPTSYPHHLAGGHARPPVAPRSSVVEMAEEAHRRQLASAGLTGPAEPVWAGVAWQLAPCLAQLREEANAANPGRDKSSDGTIGDVRHQAEGKGSDHNPWLVWNGIPWVRAEDLTVKGLDLPAAFERARQLAATGRLPQVVNGGYFILNGKITAEDFSGWRAYKGTDPHVLHGHVSVSTEPGRFSDPRPWGIFAATPGPPPPPPPPSGWTGPDLTGRGPTLRGQAAGQPQGPQSNGPRVADLQAFLNRVVPAYSHLVVDGWYGPATAAVLAQVAARSGIKGADGLNIGPQLASALYRLGFDRAAAVQRLLAAQRSRLGS